MEMLLTRRTDVIRYRQLVIDVVASAFPNSLCVPVIIASGRIKIGRQITIAEFDALLSELVSENILFRLECNEYLFNQDHQEMIPSYEKVAPSNKHTESFETRRIRLIQRRVQTFLGRQKQFNKDVQTLYHLLPFEFTPQTLLSLLPCEWYQDRRRKIVSYIMQCLLFLLRKHCITRNEKTGFFQCNCKNKNESTTITAKIITSE